MKKNKKNQGDLEQAMTPEEETAIKELASILVEAFSWQYEHEKEKPDIVKKEK